MSDYRIIARWESRGKDYIELRKDSIGYTAESNNGFVNLGDLVNTDDEAIAYMEKYNVKFLKMDRPSTKRVK